MRPLVVVTGGQTGVDRAALDAARALGVPVDGWCPRGRRAEDGPLDARYPLRETPSEAYAQRTAWNVRDSDGTLIVAPEPLRGGTAFTAEVAGQLRRPVHRSAGRLEDVAAAVGWARAAGVVRLNVAGPRQSEAPGIYDDAFSFLTAVFADLSGAR